MISRAADSSKLYYETKNVLRVSNESSVSWHNWEESVALQFTKWPANTPIISSVYMVGGNTCVILRQVILQLLEDLRANVVVCFCEGMTVRNLLKAAQRNNVTSRFLFIGRWGRGGGREVSPEPLPSHSDTNSNSKWSLSLHTNICIVILLLTQSFHKRYTYFEVMRFLSFPFLA